MFLYVTTWEFLWDTEGESSLVYLAWHFYHDIAYSRGQKPIWFCKLLGISIPIMHSGTKEILISWAYGQTGPTVRCTQSQIPFIIWPLYILIKIGRPWWHSGSLGGSVIYIQHPSSGLGIALPPRWSCSNKWFRYFWRRIGGIFILYACKSCFLGLIASKFENYLKFRN